MVMVQMLPAAVTFPTDAHISCQHTSGVPSLEIAMIRNESFISVNYAASGVQGGNNLLIVPPSVVAFYDHPPAGTNRYEIRIKAQGGRYLEVKNCRLIAREL
jgi:hypothetical protein